MERKEGRGRPGAPNSQQEGTPQKEQAKPKRESELGKLLQENGLFDKEYKLLGDPVGYHTIKRMETIQNGLYIEICRIGQNEALKKKCNSWKDTIQNLKMAYGIIVYPSNKDKHDKSARKLIKNLSLNLHQSRIIKADIEV
jgi:hypothetical protein